MLQKALQRETQQEPPREPKVPGLYGGKVAPWSTSWRM